MKSLLRSGSISARLCLPAVLLLACTVFSVASPGYAPHIYEDSEDELVPFYASNMEIVWKVPTNSLPTSLRSMYGVPFQYSAHAITNLIALIDLSPTNLVDHSVGDRIMKRRLPYHVFEAGKKMAHFPAEGSVSMLDSPSDGRPKTLTAPPVLPTEAAMAETTRKILARLELPPDELVLGKDGEPVIAFGYSTTMGYGMDKRFVQFTNTIRATIERRIDGIPFNDPHTVQVVVREGGQLQSVASHWPRVKAGRDLRPPTSEDLVEFVRSGQARCQIIPGPNLKVVQASDIRRFTVERVSFTWVMSLSPLKAESAPARYFPMATLAGTVDVADGKHFRMTVLCPATVDLPITAVKSEEKLPALPH